MNIYQEVIWDANVIYGKNGLREFSLNDFDYVNTKFVVYINFYKFFSFIYLIFALITRDLYCLIAPLKFNQWFDAFHCDGIKLVSQTDLNDFYYLLFAPLNIFHFI